MLKQHNYNTTKENADKIFDGDVSALWEMFRNKNFLNKFCEDC